MKKKYLYYLMYVTVNKINKRFYIGVHSTNKVNDGYLGSGWLLKKAIRKYGKQQFVRCILRFFENAELMYEEEGKIVDEDFFKKYKRMTYNRELGGRGGHRIWTKKSRDKMSKSQKNRFANGAKAWNDGLSGDPSSSNYDERLKLSGEKISKNHADVSGNKNPMANKNIKDYMTPEAYLEHNRKISKANKGKTRTSEHKKHYSEYAKKRMWIVNKEEQLSHTTSLDDPRIKSGEWQLGMKWKPDGDF